MLANMDFDKTSFSVDWFTPSDRCATKRLSFPKSARISLDDLVSESPWSICFPVDEALPQPRPCPIVHTPPYETACGRTNTAPPSPLVPPHERLMHDPTTFPSSDRSADWRTRASPGLLAVADTCMACGVDVDVSCFDGLDESLLVAPMDCLVDLCWDAAVYEEVFAPLNPPPVVHTEARAHARSFKCNYEQALPIFPSKGYQGSFERTRPLAAKISLPLEKFPHFLSTPSFEPYDTSLALPREKPVADIDLLYSDPDGDTIHFAPQGMYTPRRLKKRDFTLTPPSVESFLPSGPPKATLHSSRSTNTLRVLSDAYSSLTRSRRRSPN